jgi:type II secretory pathway pseudopilin PulG
VDSKLPPVYIPPHLVERTRQAKEAKAKEQALKNGSASQTQPKATSSRNRKVEEEDAVTAATYGSPHRDYDAAQGTPAKKASAADSKQDDEEEVEPPVKGRASGSGRGRKTSASPARARTSTPSRARSATPSKRASSGGSATSSPASALKGRTASPARGKGRAKKD